MHRKPLFSRRTMLDHLNQEDAFKELFEKYQTDDGLIPCRYIEIRCSADGYELVFAENPDVELFPVPESDFVINALAARPDLWCHASARFTFHPSIWGAAPMFGVPFRRAVELAKKSGFIKSKYYLPEFSIGGSCQSLLLHLRTVDDIRGRLIQIEAWQYTPGHDYAHYLHALSPDFESEVVHLDGATIRYSDRDLDTLLQDSKKVKGTEYRKHFRLDGNFSLDDMHALATEFLPGVQLYNEALGVKCYT